MKKPDHLESYQSPDYSISYQRSYVAVTGSVASSVYLSQLVSLSKRDQDTNGWIFKTSEEWQAETGLGRYEQQTARKILKEKNLLVESLSGTPARLSFRLNTDELAQLLPTEIKDVESDNHVFEPAINQDVVTNKLVLSLESKDAEDSNLPVKTNSQAHSNDAAMQIYLQKFQRLESGLAKMANQLDAKLVRIEKQLGELYESDQKNKSSFNLTEMILMAVFILSVLTVMLCVWIWLRQKV